MLSTRLIFEDLGAQIVTQIKNNLQTKNLTGKGPSVASGKLLNSIRYVATDSRLEIWAEDYIYYLVYGRRPGKRPPTSAIREWIEVKGILSGEKEYKRQGLAFAIAKSIGEKGTLIYQKGGSDLLSDVINDQLFTNIREQLMFSIVEQIRSEYAKT